MKKKQEMGQQLSMGHGTQPNIIEKKNLGNGTIAGYVA
jgi:hypothetical protein